MSKCVNEKCKKDPLKSINSLIANADGDMACDDKCFEEYQKQKEDFFANIGNDKWYNNWMNYED
jgi:hypothetical protein